MKFILAILFLVVLVLSVATSQTNERQSQAEPNPSASVDIDGKPIGARETVVARRTMSDGSVIAYRKNKREVMALVKALKEDGQTNKTLLDGQTDKKLLDPQTWLNNTCSLPFSGNHCSGHCGAKQCTYTCRGCEPTVANSGSGERPVYTVRYGYCACW